MARSGVQAMMLKDAVAELGAFESLRRVVDIGYRVAEISQIPLTPATVDELVKARDELGFTYSSTSAALAPGGANDSIEDSFDKVVSDARRLGADMVRIGMLPVPAVHLKDYRIRWPAGDAIDAHVAGDAATWQAARVGVVQFAEVGEGNLDWPSIIETSLSSGAEYLLVEQDELYGRTVWESLRISDDNLVGYGYGHLF